MPDSSSWDHQSFVDHAGWIQEHSSAWESHPHIPPHIVTSKHDHGNIDANAGSDIQTSKRIVPIIFTTRSPGIKTEQDGLYVSDGITPSHSQITSENIQHASTISSVTTNTDIYSGTKPYDLPNVGAAQHEPVPNFFNEHRVFILSIIVASALLLIVAALFLVIIIRRSRKKKMKQTSPNSTEAPTGKRARRLVKMESQEHTYEEVEINKKDGITVVGSLDIKPLPAAVENQDINKSGKGPFYFKLDESNDQPATTPVYSTPIMKQKDKIFEKSEISEKTNVHRMYSEPCHFTKTKEEGAKAQENIRYSTPAPTYFLVDPSQYHDIMSAKTTLPRAKLERQRDVTIEKYDQLDRSFKIMSSSPSSSDDLQKKATGELVTNETGPYNHLNIDHDTAHETKSSPIVDEQRNEKRVSGLFEAKGYNTLAF